MSSHHNTFADRARKSRIREREQRQFATRMRKLDNITDAQMATLHEVKAAELKQTSIAKESVADWVSLRAMGVVQEHEGVVSLTSIGAQVVSNS